MKTNSLKLTTLLVPLFCLAITGSSGCTGLSLEPTDDGSTTDEGSTGTSSADAVAGFSTNDQYLYVPHNEEGVDSALYPSMSVLEEMMQGLVKVFDPARHYPINWEGDDIPPLVTHEEVEEIMAENDQPNEYGCALPVDAGTNSLPERDESWVGSANGGCGTWATAMCNRILGETDSDTEVTRDEWNDIADGIGQGEDGGSTMTGQSEYYEDLGYSVNNKKFSGSAEDYAEMVEKIDDGCDVKLFIWKRNADGTYTNGHVETVTGASADAETATTNSWGNEGTISGGDSGGFDHSLDGTQFQDAEGNELWPAGATEVWVSYVCESGFFEGIAQALGF
ncbi:MAG: hypothetical protein HY541_08360 [Deltaproteobacteria bacterium]|nr:hypothetical protein [Deltaproteobacteria bacterium]